MDDETPLPICLAWTAHGLNQHKFLLQENDAGEIHVRTRLSYSFIAAVDYRLNNARFVSNQALTVFARVCYSGMHFPFRSSSDFSPYWTARRRSMSSRSRPSTS